MRYGAGFKLITVAALLLGPVAAARAEDEDAPSRGVARISVINGDVSVRRGDSGDWVAAAVNAPLVVQDTIATGPGSRAEVQLDYANILRLGPNAEVRLTELENRRYQMQVVRGTVVFRVLRDTDADVEVSTPQVSVRPAKKGAYRVTVFEDGQQAEIAVRSGEAEIYTPTGVEKLNSGRSMLVRGGASGPEYQFASAPPRDEFDRWNEERDRYLERSASYQYVSPSIYGAEDLDGHGRWVYDPPYGWVWVPNTGPGWAPYSHGRWVWGDYYGWTWLSYDPWGWAPFHYGRWYHGGHGWCWYPGARVGVHVWSPALVAFFGFGHGVHVGVGFGRVGWVPLAPYETYHRWYGRSYYGRGYVDRSVNITNINVTNVYRNARVHNAVSAVDYDGFGRGRHNIERVSELREASLMKGPLPVAPGRESIRFSDREVRNVPRASAGAEKFYARRQPTSVERIPFADQQRSFRQASEARGTQPAVGRGEGAARGNGGWRRSGEPAASPAGAVTRSNETRSNEKGGGNAGWRRFGERPQTAAPQATPRGEGSSATAEQPRSGEGAARNPNAIGRSRESAPQATPRGEGSSRGTSDSQKRGGEWRRFGESAPSRQQAAPQSAPQAAPERRGESNSREKSAAPKPAAPQAAPERRSEDAVRNVPRASNWQRFGEPGQAASAPRPETSSSSRSWQGFGNPSRSARESSRSQEDRARDAARVSRTESYARPAARQEPIRIAPPVVRERSTESAPRSAPRAESHGSARGSSSQGGSRESGSSSSRGSERSNSHGSGRNR